MYRNQSTFEFIHALAKYKGLIKSDVGILSSLNISNLAELYPTLISVIKGNFKDGAKQGTRMHEDVAIEFARLLDPDFVFSISLTRSIFL